MRHQLARSRHAPRPAQARVIEQARRVFGQQLVHGQGGGGVIGFDVVVDGGAAPDRLGRLEQLHHSAAASSRRRVAARRAENWASTSAAGIRRPAWAEFSPACTWRRNQAS